MLSSFLALWDSIHWLLCSTLGMAYLQSFKAVFNWPGLMFENLEHRCDFKIKYKQAYYRFFLLFSPQHINIFAQNLQLVYFGTHILSHLNGGVTARGRAQISPWCFSQDFILKTNISPDAFDRNFCWSTRKGEAWKKGKMEEEMKVIYIYTMEKGKVELKWKGKVYKWERIFYCLSLWNK